MSEVARFVSDKRARRACHNLFTQQRVAHNDDAIYRIDTHKGAVQGYKVWFKPRGEDWRWLTEDEVHAWKV